MTWSFDIDAESPLLHDMPGSGARLATMTHQMFGPLVGVPRFLDVLARHGQHATFFVPGFTAERYPDTVRAIIDGAGKINLGIFQIKIGLRGVPVLVDTHSAQGTSSILLNRV